MDRFAAYIPGWEMPKNSSEFLTNNYGFITDYLAEAFHYQFKHTNRYEEVSKRIRLGKAIEGRDEKGIKKTVCAFLKILHPNGPPTDDEFEEYVAYATECRRRVKEQMNKRKPDDEFARINLSYFTTGGEEVVVFCPESKDAPATQERLAVFESGCLASLLRRSKAQPSPIRRPLQQWNLHRRRHRQLRHQRWLLRHRSSPRNSTSPSSMAIPGTAMSRSSAPTYKARSPSSSKTRTSGCSTKSRTSCVSAKRF